MSYTTDLAQKINTIFLDSGNMLRMVDKNPVFQSEIKTQLKDLIQCNETADELFGQLTERYSAFKKTARGTMLQASEVELWTRWMLPDHSPSTIAPLASKLTQLWHDRNGRHIAKPDVKSTIEELHKRGYKLGILANAVSTLEIPEWLESDGLAQYFKAVILSSTFGRRKPDMHIFLDAAYEAGVKPAQCAYIGDDPTIDIRGARQAGYGLILLLKEPHEADKEAADGMYKADGFIQHCSDLLKIFSPN
jgi:putative hydrolase of the HAD superfamily